MPNSSAVISTVRAEMARRGLTQKDLAGALDISQASTSERLRGATPLRVDELFTIAEWLGVAPAVLLGDTPESVSA